MQCKQHKTLTIIERVFIENVIRIEEGELYDGETDWYGDVVLWHYPHLVSTTVTCSDCGFERIYGPRATLPKWVKKHLQKELQKI
jgi:hypothetical protein